MLDSLINPVHLMIIMAVVVVLFGPKRLPEMTHKLGQALRDLNSATSEIRSQIGVDDIAASVADIKSGLSLTTTDSPPPAVEIGADEPVDGWPTAGESVAEAPDTPAEAVTATADVPTHMPLDGGPRLSEPTAAGPPAIDQPYGSGDTLATAGVDESGVEAFGSLKRASLRRRPA